MRRLIKILELMVLWQFKQACMFFLYFYKRQNVFGFLFASSDKEALLNKCLHLKERICSYRSKFFHLRVDPY